MYQYLHDTKSCKLIVLLDILILLSSYEVIKLSFYRVYIILSFCYFNSIAKQNNSQFMSIYIAFDICHIN